MSKRVRFGLNWMPKLNAVELAMIIEEKIGRQHGCFTVWNSDFFLRPTLVSRWFVHFSYFIIKLKIHLPHSFALNVFSKENKFWSSRETLKVLVKWHAHWWWNLTCLAQFLWTLKFIYSSSCGELFLVLFQALIDSFNSC